MCLIGNEALVLGATTAGGPGAILAEPQPLTRAPAIIAPECPADTTASTSPALASSKQTRKEESFFLRMEAPAWSPISTTSLAW